MGFRLSFPLNQSIETWLFRALPTWSSTKNFQHESPTTVPELESLGMLNASQLQTIWVNYYILQT